MGQGFRGEHQTMNTSGMFRCGVMAAVAVVAVTVKEAGGLQKEGAMKGHVVAEAVLMGTYQKGD